MSSQSLNSIGVSSQKLSQHLPKLHFEKFADIVDVIKLYCVQMNFFKSSKFKTCISVKNVICF